MAFYAGASVIVVAVSVALVALIRRNLEEREKARHLRAIFIAIADDLVSKAEFPDRHAHQLVSLAALREGWVTRLMVMLLLKDMFLPRKRRSERNSPLPNQVPANLRAKYVTALLAFLLSDSYRCAFFGPIWRGAYSWIDDAVLEVKPDVEAHATRVLIENVGHVRPSKHTEQIIQACMA